MIVAFTLYVNCMGHNLNKLCDLVRHARHALLSLETKSITVVRWIETIISRSVNHVPHGRLNLNKTKTEYYIANEVFFESLKLLVVTARSRTGLSLQTSGDRKRPWMQPAIPQMVFQLLT